MSQGPRASVRRTAAGGASSGAFVPPVLFRKDKDTAAARGGNADSDAESDVVDSPLSDPWRAWRRIRRLVDVPSAAVATALFIWLTCFVHDPFASHTVGGTDQAGSLLKPGGGVAAYDPVAELELEEALLPAAGSVEHAENHEEGPSLQQHSSNSTKPQKNFLSGAALSAQGEAAEPLERLRLNATQAGTNQTREVLTGRAWFRSLARRRANASAAMLRDSAERLQRKSVEKLQRKRDELRQKGAQVHDASVALADAISSGQVHQRVVLVVVAAFLACAGLLQVLAAARGTLRSLVRSTVAQFLSVTLAPNELVTRPYSSWKELMVRVSFDFLNEPANLMLISIGSLQVLATWSKADPWRCKKINLLVLLLNFAYTLVQEVRAQFLAARHDAEWNSMESVRLLPGGHVEVVLAKDIEVGDLIRLRHGELCPATGQSVRSSHTFVLFNSLCETGEDCCSILSVGGQVLRGFVLAFEGAEVVIQVSETRNSVGADKSKSGKKAPSPLPRVRASSAAPPKSRRMERFPEHMNGLVMRANIAALALLFWAAVLVCALSYFSAAAFEAPSGGGGSASEPGVEAENNDSAEGGKGLSKTEKLLVTHFFSAAVQLNTVIPSMRWVVLFFLFVFLVEAARPEVHVQNWRAFRDLEYRQILYSDKTGTLTEVGMHVARLRLADTGADLLPGAPDLPWLAAVLLACNDCQRRLPQQSPHLGPRPGTSPEEIAVAEHLEDALGIVIETNPLQPGVTHVPQADAAAGIPSMEPSHSRRLVIRSSSRGGQEESLLSLAVASRSSFNPALGYREARIESPSLGGSWLVRQGGADTMAELAGSAAREAELAAEDRDRALGWVAAPLGEDGQRSGAWRYVLRASFANPPRPASSVLVAHCRSTGVAVRVLTGDACVAAMHISREIGIIPAPAAPGDLSSGGEGRRGLEGAPGPHAGAPGPHPTGGTCVAHIPGEVASVFGHRLMARVRDLPPAGEQLCVAIPGAVLRQQIEAGDGSDAWLADERIFAVIYRTRAADKAFIVRRTEELGRACRRRAANDADGMMLSPRRHLQQCMGRRWGDEGVCWMVGDAANDAEAISLDSVVGVSLRHGATPCKLGADFIVDGPGGVVAIQTELHGRTLAGAGWLLSDVCILCGMVSALTLCGVWAGGFTFLPRGFLYDDPFDARIMTLFSGGVYPLSACAAACRLGNAPPKRRTPSVPAGASAVAGTEIAAPVRSLLSGVILGALLGLAGPSDDSNRFGRWILTATCSVCLVRHALAPFGCQALPRAAAQLCGFAPAAPPASSPASPSVQSCAGRSVAAANTVWARRLVGAVFLLLAWM